MHVPTCLHIYCLLYIYIYISRHWWKRLCSSPFRGSSQEGADDTIISFGMFWTFQIIWHYSSFCNLRFAIQILTHRGILLLLLSPTYITYIYIYVDWNQLELVWYVSLHVFLVALATFPCICASSRWFTGQGVYMVTCLAIKQTTKILDSWSFAGISQNKTNCFHELQGWEWWEEKTPITRSQAQQPWVPELRCGLLWSSSFVF